MVLSDRLPAGHPGRIALAEWETEQARSEEGRRLLKNFGACLEWGHVTVLDLADFAERLGRVDWQGQGNNELERLDRPTLPCLRGVEIPGAGTVPLSRAMLFIGLVNFHMKDGKDIAANPRLLARYERRLDEGRLVPQDLDPDTSLRGPRPIVWVVPSEDIAEGLTRAYARGTLARANPADVLRDLLGASSAESVGEFRLG
jgi:hypothetical protein